MTNKNILSLYGLKWNPFCGELPDEGLQSNAQIEHFCWRVENLVMDGGFALIHADSGLGKSVALRMLCKRLRELRDIAVAEFSRPQSGLPDFYRELGALFEVDLRVSNRWGGYRTLREKWKTHINTTLFRPVLLIDEAQEMPSITLSELRLLTSENFDSRQILTVVLCGDHRLVDRFRQRDLLPLGNRIRVRLKLESYSKDELREMLSQSLVRAGAPHLMTEELIDTLVEHAAGNPRIMNTLANEVLLLGVKEQAAQLDEKLYLQAFPIKKLA